jgi:outer membrane protein assembly factor BamA
VRTSIRIIGGPGDDAFEVRGATQGVRLYDSEGDDVVSGAGKLDRKHFEEWVWTEEDRDQPRDWGVRSTPIFWTRYSSDLGLFLGGGLHREWYGFRKRPYSTGLDAKGGWSLAESKGRLEIDGRVHGENTSLFGAFSARFSGLDVINYYGLGNDSPATGGDFHKVDHQAASLQTTLGLPAGRGLTLSGGLILSWTKTSENSDRYFATLSDSLYGADEFLKLGATANVVFDPLADSETTGSRIRLSLGGTTFPDFFGDVERSFAKANAHVSALLSPSLKSPVSLAIRAGGEQVWGRFPWSEAAFLGGSSTIRGWDNQRFAGDAAAFISSELRLRIGYTRVVVPVGIGAFGFSDVGRVSLDGSSPGGWHSGVGGGIWLQPIGQPYIFRWGAGVSDETTKVYLALGLPY